MVSQHRPYIFHNLIGPDHLFYVTYRCADMAVPLPHHGGCLPDHVYPVHRTRRHLRPLTFRSFITRSSTTRAPTFRSEPYSTLSVSPLVTIPNYTTRNLGNLWCLLPTPTIHCTEWLCSEFSCRFLSCSPFPSPLPSPVRFPSHLNPLTAKSDTHPRFKCSSTHHHPPFCLQSVVYFHIYSCIPCISDYAPSHSHLITATFLSLLFSIALSGSALPIPLFLLDFKAICCVEEIQ